jgi:DNA-binding transcriptional MerR regulator
MTAKALRHYDERGVLVPAAVGPATGYRSYAGRQVRDAVLVKALRDAGVPVERVRGALADPAGVPALLAAFRAGVAAALGRPGRRDRPATQRPAPGPARPVDRPRQPPWRTAADCTVRQSAAELVAGL